MKWMVVLGLAIIVAAVAATSLGVEEATTTHDDIRIVGVVKPPMVNITPVTISVGTLDPMQEYHITSYKRKVITTNCPLNISIHLNTTTLSQKEIAVLGDPLLTILIFNASDARLIYEANANLSTWAPPFNFTLVCPLSKGAYDVSVALDGKTAVPENETEIDFSVVIEKV